MTITSPSFIVVGKSGFRDLIIVTAYGCGSVYTRIWVSHRCVHVVCTLFKLYSLCVCRMRMREHPRTCARMCVNSRPTQGKACDFPFMHWSVWPVWCDDARCFVGLRCVVVVVCASGAGQDYHYMLTQTNTLTHTHTHTGTLSCETHSHSRTHTHGIICVQC